MKDVIKKILCEYDDFDWVRNTTFLKPGDDSYVIVLRNFNLPDRLTILEGLESLGYCNDYGEQNYNQFIGGNGFCYLYLETYEYEGNERAGLALSHDSCNGNVESKDYFQNYVVITPEQLGINLH